MAKYEQQIRDALKGGAYKRGMASVVDQLASLGYKAILYALQKRKYTHRTKNLYESYASAVYVNGVFQEGSMRFLTNNQATKPYIDESGRSVTGHQLAEEFLRAQRPRDKVSVICVAAMPYAEYLEEGRHRGGYKIQVISAATDFLEEHKKEINWGIFGGYKYARVFGSDTQYGRV